MKGIFTKEQQKRLGQIGDDLLDFKEIFKNKKILGTLAEAGDGFFFEGLAMGIDDYAIDRLPEVTKEEMRKVVDSVLEGDQDGNYEQVPEMAGKAIAALNGIGPHEDLEAQFATDMLRGLMSGVRLWVAIKGSSDQ